MKSNFHWSIPSSTTQSVQIWDTAGQERFRAIASTYYRGSHCVFIVFDITSENSFKSVKHWHSEIKENIPKKSQIVLVGNKNDLVHKRMVSREEAEELANELGISYFETSATDNKSITTFFDQTVKNLLENRIYSDVKQTLVSQPSDKIIYPPTVSENSFFCPIFGLFH
jgi:small GTP-binding protein